MVEGACPRPGGGCKFSWGFGYMRQGEGRDVTTCGSSGARPPFLVKTSTNFKYRRAFVDHLSYQTQRTIKGRGNNAGYGVEKRSLHALVNAIGTCA